MKRTVRLALLVIGLMTAFLTAYTQDSLRNVPVPAWKLSRMIDEVRAGRICDTLAVKLDSTVQALKVALTAGETLIEVRTQERDLKVSEADTLRKLIEKKDELQKIEVKKEKRKGNRKGLLGITIGFIAAVIFL